MKTLLSIRSILLVLLLMPELADAHVVMGETAGWLHGMAHPFTGLDHLCAMIAVGLWAKQTGGRAIWLVPASFVSVMMAGGLLGMQGIQIPFVESGILASLLILGLLIAAAIRLPLAASVAIVGVFALFHGNVHGIEMPHTGASGYALGFVLSTAILHLTGIGIATVLARTGHPGWLRLTGAAITLLGGALYFA